MAKTKSNAQGSSDLPAGLSAPALRALAGAGIQRLAQLSKVTEAEVMGLHGFGPKGLRILRAAMEASGVRFKGVKKK
jgi:hypothetical protein